MASERPRFFVMTGLPRGGTTYLSAVLHHPPQVVTLSDPGGLKAFYRARGAGPAMLEVFEEFRRRLLDGEEVPTLEGTRGFAGRARVDTWNQKKVSARIDVAPDFTLGMKNPEVFLEHLPVFLAAGLRCVVTLRHPLSVINSWVRRKHKEIQAGRAPEGFANGESVVFTSKHDDPVERRIELHEALCARILAVRGDPGVRLLRYEEWFTDPRLLARTAAFLGIPCLDRLRPAPIPPEPPGLAADERERILRGCRAAAELGYPTKDGALLPPVDPAGRGAEDRA